MNSDEAATVHGDSLRGERERQRQRDGDQLSAEREEGQEPVGPEGHGRSGDISGSHSHGSNRSRNVLDFCSRYLPSQRIRTLWSLSVTTHTRRPGRRRRTASTIPLSGGKSSRHSFSMIHTFECLSETSRSQSRSAEIVPALDRTWRSRSAPSRRFPSRTRGFGCCTFKGPSRGKLSIESQQCRKTCCLPTFSFASG